MNTSSIIIVFCAILIPAALYFRRSWRVRKSIEDLSDFFPLKREYSSRQFRSTTVAAGMSLATVMIAFINLSPFLGISLAISVLTFCLSFVILYYCAPAIMHRNSGNQSIQGFLGSAYKSDAVKKTALIFSLLGYLSIFSMELLVGVTVLTPFLGEWVLAFAFVYLVFLVSYSMMSGFKAVIATDIWQLRFIMLSIVALVAHLFLSTRSAADSVTFVEATRTIFSDWRAPLSFALGIAIMNIPAPISDAGTWQRLCAARDVSTARRGIKQVILLFLVLWSALILCGNYYSASGVFSSEQMNEAGSLMSAIITSMASGGILNSLLLFVFILGLFSAMISTADSLLIVASQIFSMDLLRLHAHRQPNDSHPLRATRLAMLAMAGISFAIFFIFHLLKMDVVQLVFAIYGAQLAMFPSVFAALFLFRKLDLIRAKHAALLSIASGFTLAWMAALYGRFSGSTDWQFYAPVVGLAGAIIVFAAASIGAWKK